MSKQRMATARAFLFVVGVVLVGVAGKVAFAGLGAGTFTLTAWEVALVAVAGVALIVLGWQRKPRSITNSEDEIGEDINAESDS